jgi:hypothetical protein
MIATLAPFAVRNSRIDRRILSLSRFIDPFMIASATFNELVLLWAKYVERTHENSVK